MEPSPTVTDAELVRLLRAGDRRAWGLLFEAHAARLWRGVSRYLGQHEADIADVVQQTFMEAARMARSYDDTRGTVAVWLWGIARTLIRNHYRKRATQERLVNHVKMTPQVYPTDDGLMFAITNETCEQVRTILLDLPAEYERLLTAKYWHDEPLEVIAVREGISVVAVKSKLARARDAFRTACPASLKTDEVTK